MVNNYKNLFAMFLKGKIDVTEYLVKLEELHRKGNLLNLKKYERKLITNYVRLYADRFYGKEMPKFGFWERLKRNMNGYPNVDLKTLKKGTEDLLKAL